MRPSVVSAACAALLLPLACGGPLVVRAPQEASPHPGSALGRIAPLSVAVPPATGTAAASDPLGEWAAGWGRRSGAITLTERPGDLLRRLLVLELVPAGHRIVEQDPDVVLRVNVLEFVVDAPRAGRGWDVTVAIRFALRVDPVPGLDDASELVYCTENTGHALAVPGVAIVERILGEAVRDLGKRVAERDALATALESLAHRAG